MHLLAQNLSKFQNKQNSVAYLSVSLSNGRTIWIDTLDRSASLVSVNTGVVIGIFSVVEFFPNIYLCKGIINIKHYLRLDLRTNGSFI